MAVPPPPEDGDEPRNEQNPFIDMDVLRRRMSDLDDRSKAGHSPSDRVSPELVSVEEHEIGDSDLKRFVHNFEHLTSVWVIAFTSAVDGTEGIYSLSVSDENIVLAFEDKEEAQRYALCLEAQKFPAPQISELETTELCDFCNESGFRLGFVPKGSLVTPPEESAIEDLDKWRGKPPRSKGQTGMSDEEIDIMKKRLDSLFGL